jgi:hypothetical protein
MNRPPHGVRTSAVVCLVAVAAAWLPARLAAREQSRASAPAVKAAYLFNFAQFVRWPAGNSASSEPFGVCVIGKDPFGAALDDVLEGEAINGRRAIVRRMAKLTNPAACQIAFISTSEADSVEAILGAVAGQPVLTVSDLPRFIERGGIIAFVAKDNRVRFELNLPAAAAAHLVLSSELARVALAVHRGAEED